jgi:hypothetical protein
MPCAAIVSRARFWPRRQVAQFTWFTWDPAHLGHTAERKRPLDDVAEGAYKRLSDMGYNEWPERESNPPHADFQAVSLPAVGRRDPAPTRRTRGETAAGRSIPKPARSKVPTKVPTASLRPAV